LLQGSSFLLDLRIEIESRKKGNPRVWELYADYWLWVISIYSTLVDLSARRGLLTGDGYYN